MAEQKGIIQIDGTIGGINFYFRKGKPVLRKSGGGFNAKAIKTKDSMVRVRENGSEFGNASRVKRLLRLSVEESLLYFTDGTLHGRMMQLMQEIKTMDLISERGKRSVWQGLQTSEGKRAFCAFLFTPKQPIFTLLGGLPLADSFGQSCDFGNLIFNEQAFKSIITHLQLHYFVVDYDEADLKFVSYSAEKVMLSVANLPVNLPPFVVENLPSTYSIRVAYLGVQFYQNINGDFNVLKEQGMIGLRALAVYTE